MLEIDGKSYITEKEASKKYGYSLPWFRLSRKNGESPPFCRLSENSRILYPVEETNQWFKSKLSMK